MRGAKVPTPNLRENNWRFIRAITAGYDPEGANDKSMKGHLVGTRKFIGAAGEAPTPEEREALFSAIC